MATPSVSSLNAAFNPFLFATVCEERNEMPLTVISALARLNLDPWAEAAELALMPTEGAAQRLSSLLLGVADGPGPQSNRESVAARLVALLPAPVNPRFPASGHATLVSATPRAPTEGIIFLIFLASIAASALAGTMSPSAGAAPHPAASSPAPRPASSTPVGR